MKMKIPIEELREKASKGPFLVEQNWVESHRNYMADCDYGDDEEQVANAQLIAHCLNTHQQLLDALKRAKDYIPSMDGEGCMACRGLGGSKSCSVCTTKRMADKAIEAASNVEVGS